MFYLWIDEDNVQPSCMELLQVLQTADPTLFRQSYQNLIDIGGFSIMNRVACMGTPDEVDFLIKNGADLQATTDLNWDPLFHATHAGMFENLQRLVPYYPQYLSRKDLRAGRCSMWLQLRDMIPSSDSCFSTALTGRHRAGPVIPSFMRHCTV